MMLRHPSDLGHSPGLRQVPVLPQDHGPLRVLGQGQDRGAQGRDVRLVQEVQRQVP